MAGSCGGLIRLGQAFGEKIRRGNAKTLHVRFFKDDALNIKRDEIPLLPCRDSRLAAINKTTKILLNTAKEIIGQVRNNVGFVVGFVIHKTPISGKPISVNPLFVILEK